MHKRFLQFQAYHRRSQQIIIIYCLDLLFLVLAFLSVSLKYSYPLSIAFLIIDFILLIVTALLSRKNLFVVRDLENYFVSKSYGTSALRVLQYHKLMNENLFDYHFQPIVNAATGEIFAYEALMRTDPETIRMLPDEILDLSVKENRLYEIEKYTFFNVLNIMQQHPEVFKTKKLFINSLSSHQLTDEDYSKLHTTFGSLFDSIVMEITESTNLDESNMKLIHSRIKNTNCQLALDDYGTGYSNESNLLNSSPNYVKIDRSLLRFINIDSKKQHLVFNLVNFAKRNHIKVIAEGIETYEEFEYVINLGVDFIQGYYTARPNPVMLDRLPEEILQRLQKINFKKSNDNNSEKVYEASSEESLVPVDIASNMYSAIIVNQKELILKGSAGKIAEISLIIPDNHRCRLIFDNLRLKGVEISAVSIGKNCSVEIILKGDNHLSEDGIRVPDSSDLIITGDGDLTIYKEKTEKVCIGGTGSQSYGNITLASTGTIKATCHGSLSVAIGGGQNPSDYSINLISGNIQVLSTGYQCIGVGSISGNGKIYIEDCSLKIETEGTKTVAIGSITGSVNIISRGKLDLKAEGQKAVCIGAIDAVDGSIIITGGTVNVNYHTHTGSGIGSINGKQTIEIHNGDLYLYGEGTELVGIGDHIYSSYIRILNGILSMLLYATDVRITGNQPNELIIDGGNIQCDFPAEHAPVNSNGTSLVSHIVTNTDEFHQTIENVSSSYEYLASYSDRYPYIKVYIPENSTYNSF